MQHRGDDQSEEHQNNNAQWSFFSCIGDACKGLQMTFGALAGTLPLGKPETEMTNPPPMISHSHLTGIPAEKLPYVLRLNCLAIGDSGVGKSSIVQSWCEGAIPQNHHTTIGVEFASKIIRLADKGTKLKLHIWDTSGHESFRSLTRSYYTNAALVFVVFDVCNRASFEGLHNWLSRARELLPPEACAIIVGNKSDEALKRKVTSSEAQARAEALECPYFEVSAKTQRGVREVFAFGANHIWTEVQERRLDPDAAKGIKVLR